MTSSFQGKRIALTGCASGIGLATAQILASRGAILSLADVNESKLEFALSTLDNKDKHIITVVDVRSSSVVNDWLSATASKLGGLDGLANIAGVCVFDSPLRNETDENWNFVMDANAKGTFNTNRAALQHLSTNGSIVNVASIAGLRGLGGMSVYTASKHAVVGLTKALAKEVGGLGSGIRVNAVAPGAKDTPMLQRIDDERDKGGMSFAHLPLQRKGAPEEIARVICFLLSDEASFVTGSVYSVDTGENA